MGKCTNENAHAAGSDDRRSAVLARSAPAVRRRVFSSAMACPTTAAAAEPGPVLLISRPRWHRGNPCRLSHLSLPVRHQRLSPPTSTSLIIRQIDISLTSNLALCTVPPACWAAGARRLILPSLWSAARSASSTAPWSLPGAVARVTLGALAPTSAPFIIAVTPGHRVSAGDLRLASAGARSGLLIVSSGRAGGQRVLNLTTSAGRLRTPQPERPPDRISCRSAGRSPRLAGCRSLRAGVRRFYGSERGQRSRTS